MNYVDLLNKNALSYSLLFIFILGLIYTAHIIKNEKKVFLKNTKDISLHHFLFKIPLWWDIKKNQLDEIEFFRSDTRYDWSATFRWIELDEHLIKLSIEDIFKKFIEDKKMLFDQDTTIIHGKQNLIKDPKLNQFDMVRIEGTATEDDSNRIYYDGLLLRKDNGLLFCESKSGVLNGIIEGPYFEEVIGNMALN